MLAEVLRLINTLFFFLFGVVVFIHIARNWKNPNKINVRYSELIYSILFFINGYLVYSLFENEPVNQNGAMILYLIMFVSIFGTNFFVFVLNIIPNAIKVKRNPDLIDNDPVITRNYQKFLQMFEEGCADDRKKKDLKKDFSRKLLHVIQMSGIVLIHYFSIGIEGWLVQRGMTPLAFRNTLYIFIGSVFIFMFTGADLVRITNFKNLPNWARKWYCVSLDPKSESYTINSAVPFLLTALLFMFSPFNILVAASTVSCLADGVASVVGKSFGHHKFNNFGKFPNKSFEGLYSGMLTAFLGVFLVFYIFIPPPGISLLMAVGLGMISALIFLLVDAFSTKIADNILNTLLPGLAFHFILSFM